MQKKDHQPHSRSDDHSYIGGHLPHDGSQMAGGAAGEEVEEKIRLEVRDRSQMKFRTHEPVMEERVGLDDVSVEDEWNIKTPPTRKHRVLWIWIGLIIAVGIGWLVLEITKLKEHEERVIAETKMLTEQEEQAERDAWQTVETIRAVVKQFHASGSLDEMLKHVRQLERVRPMMTEYYSKKTLKADEVDRIMEMSPLTIGNRSGFWVVVTELESGEKGKLVVEVKSPTEAKVDWETYVCAQPMDWEKFVKERPSGYRGDFRVYVSKDDFYNYEFADSKKYQCFKITTIDSYEAIYGYAPRDGDIHKELELLIAQNPDEKTPVMLRLYLQEGLQSKSGALIEAVVAPRWLLVDLPEESK